MCVIQGSYQLVQSALNLRCVYSLVFNVAIGLVALNLAFVRLWRLWYLHFSADDALERWRSKLGRHRERSRSISMAVRQKIARVRSGSLSLGRGGTHRDRKSRPRSRSVPSSPHPYTSAFASAFGAPSLSSSRRNSMAFTHRKEQADHESLVAILDRGITSMNVLQHLHAQSGVSNHSDSTSFTAATKTPHHHSSGAGGATGPASAPGSPVAKASMKAGTKAASRKTGRMRSNSLPAAGVTRSSGGHTSRAYATSTAGDRRSSGSTSGRYARVCGVCARVKLNIHSIIETKCFFQ